MASPGGPRAEPDKLTLGDATDLADRTALAGRAPEDLERRADRLLATAYALRGRRGDPDDAHERKHLVAMAMAGLPNARLARGPRCGLKVLRYGERYALSLAAAWPEGGPIESVEVAKTTETPESLERQAMLMLVAAYVMRDRRKAAVDAHGRKHLMAAIEAGSSGHCRSPHCVLRTRRAGGRYTLDLDVPWNEHQSDFHLN
jgi:hypothetical protein